MDSFRKRVTVIMPTYNGEKYIQEQVSSISGQSFRDFSLHIYDDSSTDETVRIVADLAAQDKRIYLHRNICQKGVKKNISDALAEIGSDIYFLADQDDIWLPEKMATQLRALLPEDVVMSFSNLLLVDKNGQSLGIDFWNSQEINPSEANQAEIIAIKTMVTGCTMAFKKRLLDIALPIPGQATMHDHWLSFFAAKTGKVVPVSEPLVLYRQHSNNTIGASITPRQRRDRRYEGCVTYPDFKERKYQSYHDLLISICTFEQRLKEHNLDQPSLKKYIAFYERLINHQWIGALYVALKTRRLPRTNGLLRTLGLTFFFPLVFLFLKFFKNVGNSSGQLRNKGLNPW